MSPTLTALRSRYNVFIQDHEVAWELVMAALAVAFLVVGFVSDEATGAEATALTIVELALTGVFAAEFLSRFLAAHDRRRYLRGHWIDVIALVPTVRGFRLLRLIRLFRLVRTFAGIYRALASFERLATHKSLVWLFLAWLGVAVICSAAFFLAENGVNPSINTPVDALWWGIVTLSTVGYGDIFPATPEGRLAAGALMVLGITLWAAITGTITSFLIIGEARGEGIAVTVPEQIRQLGELVREGLLTEQEFETKKAELLARM